jgi:predicted nucleic acid-binding protein
MTIRQRAACQVQLGRSSGKLLTARRLQHGGWVLGITIIGTAGVVVLAKRRGLIESTEGALRRLQDAGLWMAESLITKLAAADGNA